MTHLSLHLLGTYQATLNDQPVKGFDSDSVRALLAYLGVETNRPHRRESLAGLLWPEQPDQTARSNLRYALSNLRRVIGDRTATPPFLRITRQTLQFNPKSDSWVDVTAFSQNLPHQDTPPYLATITQLEETLALYRGDFLAGFSLSHSAPFEEWVLFTREKLVQQAAAVLRQLLQYYQQHGNIAAAQAHARHLLQLEPWNEETHQTLMRLLALDGQRSAALAQYRSCRQILADELGVEPLPETTHLYNRIRDGELEKEIDEIPDKTIAFSPITLYPDPTANHRPFVAREHELAQLDQTLKTTLAGEGRVMFITGEAGSGKTTLIHHFIQQAMVQHRNLVVARGICNAYTGLGDPYLPFREIVQTLTGDIETKRAGGDLNSEHARRLWAMWPEAIRILLDAGPDLIDLFVPGDVLAYRAETFLPTTHRADWQNRLAALAQRQTASNAEQLPQQNIFQQVARVLHALARHCPLVLVLDDLQWADSGSLNLLFHLSRTLVDCRIFIIGAYRPTDVMLAGGDDRHPLPAIVNEIKRLLGDCHLNLDQADGRQLVEAYLDAQPNRLDHSFRETFFQQTGGNPLFTVELLDDLQASGVLVKDETGQWVETSDVNWQQLPTRVEAVIAERIGRLPEMQQTLLRIAAVEGEEFTAEVVARIQGVDPQKIIQTLSSVLGKRHQLVQSTRLQFLEAGGQRLSRYRFRHNLFQQYLYNQLDEPECLHLHEAIGNLLETFHHHQETPELASQLAWHFEAAGRTDKAVGYRLKVGKRAMRMSAAKEAVDHFKRGLALLETLPESPAQARQELDLQINLSIALTSVGGWNTQGRTQALERAYELAQQIGEPSPQLLMVLLGFVTTKAMQENWPSALRQAEQLTGLAQQIQDPSYTAVAYAQSGIGLVSLGDHTRARSVLERAIALYDRQQRPHLTLSNGIDIEVSSYAWLSLPVWALGYPDQSLAHSQKALSLSKTLKHNATVSIALMHAIGLHIIRGENLQAQTLIENSVRLAQEQELLVYLAWVAPYQGWLQTERGQTEIGIANIQAGLTSWQTSLGARDMFSQVLVLLAQTCAKVGQTEQGLKVIDQALTQIDDTGERFLAAEAYRTKGELLLKAEAGRMKDEVEFCFLQAIEISREQQAKMWELRATISLARLWQQNSKGKEARSMLAKIYNWFTEGFDTPDLQAARMLLEELSFDSE